MTYTVYHFIIPICSLPHLWGMLYTHLSLLPHSGVCSTPPSLWHAIHLLLSLSPLSGVCYTPAFLSLSLSLGYAIRQPLSLSLLLLSDVHNTPTSHLSGIHNKPTSYLFEVHYTSTFLSLYLHSGECYTPTSLSLSGAHYISVSLSCPTTVCWFCLKQKMKVNNCLHLV